MDNGIKISVVIPAYNAQDYILDAIKSVYSQTCSVYEIVIVDDGSSDGTFEKLQNYKSSQHLHNLVICKQKNSGPSIARNRGVELSQGNWIAFLDADDYWREDKIELQTNLLKKYPEVVLISGILKNCGANKRIRFYFPKFHHILFRNPFFTSSVMVKKEIFNKYKFNENQKYSEDYRLFLEITYQYPSIIMNENLTIYNSDDQVRENSLSSRLWSMEKGELSNYQYFYRKGNINFFYYSFCSLFSLMKFGRRWLMKKI